MIDWCNGIVILFLLSHEKRQIVLNEPRHEMETALPQTHLLQLKIGLYGNQFNETKKQNRINERTRGGEGREC